MTVRLVPSPPPREPRLELLETCWRMRGPSQRVLSCGIYAVETGLEVRAGYGDDLLHSQRAVDVIDGWRIADALRQAVIAKGGFEDLEK